MLARIARLAIAAPKRIVAAAALILVAAAIFGLPVTKSLSAGGFTDPRSESVQAADILTDKFGHSDVQLLIAITADDGVYSAAASAVAAEVTYALKNSPDVTNVAWTWSAPPPAAAGLTTRDGKTGIIIAGLRGTDAEFAKTARQLVDQMPHDRDGVVVRAGGALTFAEANEQGERDLVKMELIAIPLSFVALVWVFGGLFAAALPLTVGVFAILGSLAVLRAITFFTDVSLFALNLTAAITIPPSFRHRALSGPPANDDAECQRLAARLGQRPLTRLSRCRPPTQPLASNSALRSMPAPCQGRASTAPVTELRRR
jgi:putative drug exporter of the RND superfamily